MCNMSRIFVLTFIRFITWWGARQSQLIHQEWGDLLGRRGSNMRRMPPVLTLEQYTISGHFPSKTIADWNGKHIFPSNTLYSQINLYKTTKNYWVYLRGMEIVTAQLLLSGYSEAWMVGRDCLSSNSAFWGLWIGPPSSLSLLLPPAVCVIRLSLSSPSI